MYPQCHRGAVEVSPLAPVRTGCQADNIAGTTPWPDPCRWSNPWPQDHYFGVKTAYEPPLSKKLFTTPPEQKTFKRCESLLQTNDIHANLCSWPQEIEDPGMPSSQPEQASANCTATGLKANIPSMATLRGECSLLM